MNVFYFFYKTTKRKLKRRNVLLQRKFSILSIITYTMAYIVAHLHEGIYNYLSQFSYSYGNTGLINQRLHFENILPMNFYYDNDKRFQPETLIIRSTFSAINHF